MSRPELAPLQAHSKFLTVAQVAQLLGLKEGSIRRMVSEGRIPYRKCGRAVRFNLGDIDKWSAPRPEGR